jgi:hypothetical protein
MNESSLYVVRVARRALENVSGLMIFCFAVVPLLLSSPIASASGVYYYASPRGSGMACSQASPCTIRTGLQRVAPGDTLWLLDGTYRETSGMIAPPAGKSGTSAERITIRAVNDGAVVIDGQFQRRPVSLHSNSWWVLQGFNAKQGVDSVIYVADQSNNNIFRRIVAWDAWINANSIVWSIDASDGNLVEDVAVFGAGGRSIQPAFGQQIGQPRNVLRRVWARYEGSIDQVYAQAITLNYGNFQGATCENCLATYTLESMPENYYLTGRGLKQTPANKNCGYRDLFGGPCPAFVTNYGLRFVDQGGIIDAGDGFGPGGARIFGSLGYIVSVHGQNNVPPGVVNISDQKFTGQHILSYVDPNFSQKNSIRAFHKLNPKAAGSLSNLTSVAAMGHNISGGNLAITDLQSATSAAGLTAAQNPWTGTSGAQLCYRWVDEQLTTTPLWPWPMNDRIEAATESAGNYFANGGPGCEPHAGQCSGTLGHTRTATNITADVQRLLGPLPAQCTEGP